MSLKTLKVFFYRVSFDYIQISYLGMHYGKGVHPDSPAAILILDGVVEQHPEERVHHVTDLLLFVGAGMNVSQCDQPLLQKPLGSIKKFKQYNDNQCQY